MPADGISLPLKRDFGTSRWGGSKLGYINGAIGRKGSWPLVAQGGPTQCAGMSAAGGS